VEEEKPYWMNLTGGTTFSGPLRYELEIEEVVEDELYANGGDRV